MWMKKTVRQTKAKRPLKRTWAQTTLFKSMAPKGISSGLLSFVRPPGTPDYQFRHRKGGGRGCHLFDGVVNAGIEPLVHRIIQADMTAMVQRLSGVQVPLRAATEALVHERASTKPGRKSRPVKDPKKRGQRLHDAVETAVKSGTFDKAGGRLAVIRNALRRHGWVVEKAEEPCNWASIKVGTRIDLVCRASDGSNKRALFNLKTTQSNLSKLMSPQVRFAGSFSSIPGSVLNAYHLQVLGEVVLWKKCFPSLPVHSSGLVVATNDQRAFVIETPEEIKRLEGQMERDVAVYSSNRT
jgi:hypothetical protein